MLKRFSVKNFKAFEDKVTLDLSSIGNYEFNKECISNGICKTSLLYGKNASGKSSLCFCNSRMRLSMPFTDMSDLNTFFSISHSLYRFIGLSKDARLAWVNLSINTTDNVIACFRNHCSFKCFNLTPCRF